MAELGDALPGFNEERAIRRNSCPVCGQVSKCLGCGKIDCDSHHPGLTDDINGFSFLRTNDRKCPNNHIWFPGKVDKLCKLYEKDVLILKSYSQNIHDFYG